ncbi:MAG TPA: hypothetical protein V6C81_28165 [Planktothrix sp.]|jgi:hypothetical protein
MIWLLSLVLCFGLLGGILMMFVPELFPVAVAQRWARHFHYFR